MQDGSNSIANALELLQSYTKPSNRCQTSDIWHTKSQDLNASRLAVVFVQSMEARW